MDKPKTSQWRVIEWESKHSYPAMTLLGWRNQPGQRFKTSNGSEPITEERALELVAKPLAVFDNTIVFEMVKDHPAFVTTGLLPRVFIKLLRGRYEWACVNIADGKLEGIYEPQHLGNEDDIAPEEVVILTTVPRK